MFDYFSNGLQQQSIKRTSMSKWRPGDLWWCWCSSSLLCWFWWWCSCSQWFCGKRASPPCCCWHSRISKSINTSGRFSPKQIGMWQVDVVVVVVIDSPSPGATSFLPPAKQREALPLLSSKACLQCHFFASLARSMLVVKTTKTYSSINTYSSPSSVLVYYMANPNVQKHIPKTN